jgi:hypothetical protein
MVCDQHRYANHQRNTINGHTLNVFRALQEHSLFNMKHKIIYVLKIVLHSSSLDCVSQIWRA